MAGRNEVTIDVVVRERGGKRTLKDVGDEAKKTGTSFEQMAKDSKSLSEQLFKMDIQIRKTAQEMERTGDTSLVKVINKQRRELNALAKVRKDVLGISFGGDGDKGGKAGGLLGSGARAGGRIGEGLTESLMALRGPALAGAAILGTAMAPLIGGVIASAVIGGTGVGGIIGGLALAARDSRVQDAGQKLGQHALTSFSRSAEPFIAPAIEAMGVLRGVVDDVSGDMRQAFATIAPVLVPLTQGIGGMINQMMPGIIKAMEGARPVLLIVSRELPKIGAALGHFLATIAEDPRGAMRAFQDLSRIIQITIVSAGHLISFLSKVWGTLGPILQAAQGDIKGMIISVGETEAALADAAKLGKDASSSFMGLGESAESATEKLANLQSTIDGLFDRTLNIREANRNYEKAVDDLTAAIHENGRTLDIGTEKGRANQEMIDKNIKAIKDIRDANINNKMAVEQANAIYDQQLEQLRKTLISLGLNKAEVNSLIDAIKAIPTTAEVEVRAPGLLDALRQARELSALLGSTSAAARVRAGDSSGYGGGRASGGLMQPGMTYDVGERGIERVKMLSGGGAVVYNNDQTTSAMGSGFGAVAAVRPLVRITAAPSGNAAFDALVQVMWPFLLKQVSIEGGDLAAFGAA